MSAKSAFRAALHSAAKERIKEAQIQPSEYEYPGCLPYTPEEAASHRAIFDGDIERLLDDEYYLGSALYDKKARKSKLWPKVKQDLLDLFVDKRYEPINFAVFIEGIGSGKSRTASVITWLLWFDLTTLSAGGPIEYYSVVDGSYTALLCMSRTAAQARKITFDYVWPFFECPFNREYFPPDPSVRSEIRIDRNKTIIFPGTANAMSALGYNCFGGTIDEANFLDSVMSSTRADEGGEYDAAEAMYNAIWQRMTSRFMEEDGRVRGLITMISSTRYADDFLERQANLKKDPTTGASIFVRRRDTWDAKPTLQGNKGWVYYDTETLEILEPDDSRILEFEAAEHRGELNEYGGYDASTKAA
tara:strand:- start:130 stop:1209 length:1080 start_codon:yes stop_codon:yes gene_type:complete